MVKVRKDNIKNMYCSTCNKWMTEFYLSRHIQSKFHFTKKYFQTEYLHKSISLKKHSKKKRSAASKSSKTNQKKPAPVVQPQHEHYEIQGDVITKQNNDYDTELVGVSRAPL